jgi:serine-type D-Ala-D-Ala carboxypeptidase/endopeptidase (penicillin-binding protein 4)
MSLIVPVSSSQVSVQNSIVIRLRRRLRAVPAALLVAAAALPELAPTNVAAQPLFATREAHDARLAARIDAVIGSPALRGVAWGIEVRDAETGRVLYGHGADRPMPAASALKLVGAAAAVHYLSPEYRFRTTLYADGEVRDGTLHGDLVLYGRGDPTISARHFATRTAVLEGLADSLRARGIRRIAGGVVADESWFDGHHLHPDWNETSRRWWYGAPVSALGFNDNAIDIRVEPGAGAGRPARITVLPPSGFHAVENRTTTVAAGRPWTVSYDRVPGTNRFVATGQVPRDAGVRVQSVAVVDPAGFAGTVFREVLERSGIEVARREVRVAASASSSASAWAVPLVEYRSPALTAVIDPILRNSQNWFSEQVVKTLGREVQGEGSWAAGLALTETFLVREVGVPWTEFGLRDASGLSAFNRITPSALATLLEYVYRTPEQALVRESLPVSGRTGSLRARLADLGPRVRAKTGFISGVNALAGYVTTASGTEAVFVVVAHDTGQPRARIRQGIDDVVRAVARD